MKKTVSLVIAFVLILLCGTTVVSAQNNKVFSTVVGSYSFDGFVPNDITVYSGELVVCDQNNHRISVVDMGGGKVGKVWGGYGKNKNNLAFPKAVEVYGKELLVCDSGNNRVVFLNSSYDFGRELVLANEPNWIAVNGDRLYVLYKDGVTVEAFNLKTLKADKKFSLKHKRDTIDVLDGKIIAKGNGNISTLDLNTLAYKEINNIKGVKGIGVYKDRLYAIRNNGFEVYNGSFVKEKAVNIVRGGDVIAPLDDGVLIGSTERACVEMYKGSNLTATFGRPREAGEIKSFSVWDNLVAVLYGRKIVMYKNGKVVDETTVDGVVKVGQAKGVVYGLKANSIEAYSVDENGNISNAPYKTLKANGEYEFNDLAIYKDNIYITESKTEKLLKVDKDLKVFSTAVVKGQRPKSVAVGNGKIYMAEQGYIGVYDMAGKKTGAIDGEYTSIAYRNRLVAVEQDGKSVTIIDTDADKKEKVTNNGYFLALKDVDANKYGIYFLDGIRREIVAYTRGLPDISEDNIKVDDEAFNGKATRGQWITVEVVGGGTLNPLPNIGDVRYLPVYSEVDALVPFKENDGKFTAKISMNAVGNYTLKVAYQKQVYTLYGWTNDGGEGGSYRKEFAVSVGEDKALTEDEAKEAVDMFVKQLKKKFKL